MIFSERYQRNICCDKIGESGQAKLSKAKVVVVGAGGLGGYLLQHLAAMGVGVVKIIEFDTVSLSNLNRQILYNPADVGFLKGDRAKARIEQFNPEIGVELCSEKLNDNNAAELLKGFDVVVDCVDNFAARYVIDRACKELKTPMVHGAVEGFKGEVSVFHGESGTSYSDLYGEQPVEGKAVGVTSPVVAIVASYQALEVMKIVCNLGGVLYNKLLVLDLLNGGNNMIFEL